MAAPLKASICFLLGKIEIDERTVLGMRGVRGPILGPNLRLPYFSCTDVIDYVKICPVVP